MAKPTYHNIDTVQKMKFNEIDLYFLAMTKAALDNATSAMAVELAKHKVGQIRSIYCKSSAKTLSSNKPAIY